MEDVRVPKENVLPGIDGLGGPFSCLNNVSFAKILFASIFFGIFSLQQFLLTDTQNIKARFGIGWGAGAVEFCLHQARQYTLTEQFGVRCGESVGAEELADMMSEIALGYQACLRVGRLKETGNLIRNDFTLSETTAESIANRTGSTRHGCNGISDEYHIIRHVII